MAAPTKEAILVALLLLRTSGETFLVAPVKTSETCMRGYAICSYALTCPGDYSLECQEIGCDASEQVCADLGVNFRPSEWNGHCNDWPDVSRRYECCQCIGFEPLPATHRPASSGQTCHRTSGECPTSLETSCCKEELSCQDGFELSAPISVCGATACDQLGSSYISSEVIFFSQQCVDVYARDQTLCNTCVEVSAGSTSQAPATTVPSTTGTTVVQTTSQQGSTTRAPSSDFTSPTRSGEFCITDGYSICEYVLECPGGYNLQCQGVPCDAEAKTCSELGSSFTAKRWNGHCEGDWPDEVAHRFECCRCARSLPSDVGWEYVGSPGNGACRGRNSDDNAPSYYTVHEGITTLEACQGICIEQFPSCKGIEFSHGRCETWTRPEGIFVWKELNISGFTCMRFGWLTRNLVPVDGGEGRACRGDGPGDNSDDYYVVVASESLQECQAACSAAPLCHGIEFSRGRCEIWQRPIAASLELANFTCKAYYPEVALLPPPLFTEKEPIILP
ncbi:unnamed protein product [Symbiodinium natans]|uniref:Apple domain-containing protein n=1 Tax=Symbiodinium natans TaxID=878477 RepID=A0A812SFQ2_9DINO|nr:unnamed protein product [Symbiodinium natans]